MSCVTHALYEILVLFIDAVIVCLQRVLYGFEHYALRVWDCISFAQSLSSDDAVGQSLKHDCDLQLHKMNCSIFAADAHNPPVLLAATHFLLTYYCCLQLGSTSRV